MGDVNFGGVRHGIVGMAPSGNLCGCGSLTKCRVSVCTSLFVGWTTKLGCHVQQKIGDEGNLECEKTNWSGSLLRCLMVPMLLLLVTSV